MLMKLIRVDQHYFVEHWQEWMREPLTGYAKRSVVVETDDGKKKRDLKKVSEPCYVKSTSDNSALFLAGLLDEFTEAAKKKGYEVEVLDGRNPNPNSIVPNMDLADVSFRHKQKDVLDLIVNNDKGIIECSVGYGKSFLLSQLCRMYSTAKIVICTASKVVVEQTYKSLVASLGAQQVGLLRGGTPSSEDDKRVVVATCRSLCRANVENCDFLFFDEVHNVGFNDVFKQLVERCGPCRMYGFTASLTRGDGAIKAIKALFGKVLIKVSYQEAAEHSMVTPIKAFMPQFETKRFNRITGIQYVDERINYWQNHDRNAFFARASLDVPENEQLVITVKTLEHAIFLKHHQPELAHFEIIHSGSVNGGKKNYSAFTPETAPTEPVAIRDKFTKAKFVAVLDIQNPGAFLLASEENANDQTKAKRVPFVQAAIEYEYPNGEPFAYVEILPDMVGGVDTSIYKMTPKQVADKVAKLTSGELKRVIATTSIKEGGNFHHISYIFRADGSTSGVINTQFPGRASRLAENKPVSILLDPFDVSNDWVRFRSMQRYKWYTQHGWIV